METTNEAPATVHVGNRELPVLVAALLAQEADRLDMLPGQVGDVVIPDPAPTTVRISEYDLPIEIAAQIAVEAEATGKVPEDVLATIVEDHAKTLFRKDPPVGQA